MEAIDSVSSASALAAPSSPRLCFVVDCGSHHTSVFKLSTSAASGLECKRDKIFDHKRRLARTDDKLGKGVALAVDILVDDQAQARQRMGIFATMLHEKLQELGDDGHASVFLGGTGGCRKRMLAKDDGRKPLRNEAFALLADVLCETLGSRVRLKILDGEEEAMYEAAATRASLASFATLAASSNAPPIAGMCSGGGESCQFVQYGTADCTPWEKSLALRSDRAMCAEVRERGREALQEIETTMRKMMGEKSSERLTGMQGTWICVESHADFAELGMGDEFVKVGEARHRIHRIIEDLLERKGDGWALAQLKWKDYAPKNFAIGVVSGLRLLVLLDIFDEKTAVLFFPVKSAKLPIGWSLGRYIKYERVDAAQQAALDLMYPAFHGVDHPVRPGTAPAFDFEQHMVRCSNFLLAVFAAIEVRWRRARHGARSRTRVKI